MSENAPQVESAERAKLRGLLERSISNCTDLNNQIREQIKFMRNDIQSLLNDTGGRDANIIAEYISAAEKRIEYLEESIEANDLSKERSEAQLVTMV